MGQRPDRDEVYARLRVGLQRLEDDAAARFELRAPGDVLGGRAVLEASGGITLETVRAAAQAGLQFVSVGALTHSAPALDLSLLLEAI